jgi:hypothetical protein
MVVNSLRRYFSFTLAALFVERLQIPFSPSFGMAHAEVPAFASNHVFVAMPLMRKSPQYTPCNLH